MAIFQCDLRRKNYGALWNNLFNFFHLHSQKTVLCTVLNRYFVFLFAKF